MDSDKKLMRWLIDEQELREIRGINFLFGFLAGIGSILIVGAFCWLWLHWTL